MTTPNSIYEAAKLLDRVMPGWAEKIDINQLDMCVYNKCILGQLYGDYTTGIRGFSYASPNPFGSCADKDEWIKEIKDRTIKSRPVINIGRCLFAINSDLSLVPADGYTKSFIKQQLKYTTFDKVKPGQKFKFKNDSSYEALRLADNKYCRLDTYKVWENAAFIEVEILQEK